MDCCNSCWRVKSHQAELVDKFSVTNLYWEDVEVVSNGFTRLARINIRYGKVYTHLCLDHRCC